MNASKLMCLFMFFTTSLQAYGADDSVQLKKRLFEEGVKGWSKLGVLEENVSGVFHHKSWALHNAQKNESWGVDRTIRFLKSGDLLVLKVTHNKVGNIDTYVIGKTYGFRFDQKNEQSPIVLRAMTSKESMTNELTKSSVFFRALQCKREIWNTSLQDLIGDPGFALKEIRSLKEDEQEVVEMIFNRPAKKNQPEFKNATIAFLPEYDWAVKRVEHAIGDSTVKMELQYMLNKESIPAIKKYSRSLHYPKEKVDEYYEMTFDDVSYGAIPEAVFTLKHYGLPEPDVAMPVQVQSRMHLWLIVCACLLFVSAIVLRLIAMRNNQVAMKGSS